MTGPDSDALDTLDWRRSSKCEASGCVEVAEAGNFFFVRNSKSPNWPILKFTRDEWDAFRAGVTLGEF